VIREFVRLLRAMVIEEKEPTLLPTELRLSGTQPFPTSKKLYEGRKSVFNFTPCDNDYEIAFARFLDDSEEIKSFAKLTEQFGFCIPYTDILANLRNYYPDFVAVDTDGNHYLIETKGRDDLDVLQKDNYARIWCEKASALCQVNWKYIKVMQRDFEDLHPDNLEELLRMVIW